VLWSLDNGLIFTCILFFCKYIHIIHRNTQTQYKQTCSCTQMFALCGNRTCDLLRSRRVFPPLRHIGRPKILRIYRKNSNYFKSVPLSFHSNLILSRGISTSRSVMGILSYRLQASRIDFTNQIRVSDTAPQRIPGGSVRSVRRLITLKYHLTPVL
jgi:hypothetical protein